MIKISTRILGQYFILPASVLVALILFAIQVKNLPKKAVEMEGVALGMSMGEVKYSLGSPPYIGRVSKEKTGKEVIEMHNLKELGESAIAENADHDFFHWTFFHDSGGVNVEFNANDRKVSSVSCWVSKNEKPREKLCGINNVKLSDKEDAVIARLGQPATEEIQDGTKIITYPKLNMVLRLEKKSVVSIKIKDFL